MRNIKYLICAVAIVFFTNCTDLVPEVYDSISPTIFPKTEADALSTLATDYYPLTIKGIFRTHTGLIPTMEYFSDIGNCQWGAYWLPYLDLMIGPNVESFTKWYSDYMPVVSKMTSDIELISNMEINANKKERFIAEIKCARGWLMYILYDLYGPIPIIKLEILQKPFEDVYVKRATQSEMVAFIEQDLMAAVEKLDYKYFDSDYGRFNKGVANMLLLKLYMKEKNWAKAEETARELTKPQYG